MENRLTPDGYILLSAAVDLLAGGKRRMRRHDLQAALKTAGHDWPLSKLDRVSEVRGRLIHQGMTDMAVLYLAWYDLEEIARALLRHGAGLHGGWPVRVPMYEGPALEEPRHEDVQQAQVDTQPPAQPLLALIAELARE